MSSSPGKPVFKRKAATRTEPSSGTKRAQKDGSVNIVVSAAEEKAKRTVKSKRKVEPKHVIDAISKVTAGPNDTDDLQNTTAEQGNEDETTPAR